MKHPAKTLLDYTWVGWLNVIFLQWLGLRLGYGDKWRVIYGVIPLCGWFKPSKHYRRACERRHYP